MLKKTEFYINGAWVAPVETNLCDVINPADETVCAQISLGSKADIDKAVMAARAAFVQWSQQTELAERIELLAKFLALYEARNDEMAAAITLEMGAPMDMSRDSQSTAGSWHMQGFLDALETYEFEKPLRDDARSERIIHEPIGVCGLITPWNWPMNQVSLKVAAAVVVGCTVVLKPSEVAPLSSMLFAEWMDEVGFPKGVFNLVNGDGLGAGEAMSRHEDIDMISFTGSTRAGMAITKAGADTIKRVTLELGGKSPFLIFKDADLPKAVAGCVNHVMTNTGQSCNAPTRLLVERDVYEDVVSLAGKMVSERAVGDPSEPGNHIGPLVSQIQFDKVQELISAGISEGARLVTGGAGRPDGFNRGYYVRPTVFADVDNDMRIAREEIFGPVVSILPFDSEDEAIEIANDTPYGLSAYVHSGDQSRAQKVARQLRAGMVAINGVGRVQGSPFGGYKQSGLGREGGTLGLEDFLEVKAVSGWDETA